jgi:hypothetical protein
VTRSAYRRLDTVGHWLAVTITRGRLGLVCLTWPLNSTEQIRASTPVPTTTSPSLSTSRSHVLAQVVSGVVVVGSSQVEVDPKVAEA